MAKNEKKKKNSQQLMRNALAWGIVLLLVFMLVIFLVFKEPPGDKIEALLVNVTSSLLVGIFVATIWDYFVSIKKDEEDDLIVKEIHRAMRGLQQATVQDTFMTAASFIPNCDEVRVIGTAKQDYHQGSVRESVDIYLKATIARIQNKKPLKYRRLTTLNLKPNFKNHIDACFKANDFNHDIKVMLLEDFLPAYTYLAIDNKFLMISLNYPEQSIGVNDQLCFYTLDETIIEYFKGHFFAIWREEKEINKEIVNDKDFEYLVNYQVSAAKNIRSIKTAINHFPNRSTFFQQHALNELSEVANKINGMADHTLEINHSRTNGNLVSLFCSYIKMLSKGDRYETITFARFWYDILRNENMTQEFINSNKIALESGASLERLLVVDENRINLFYDDMTGTKLDIQNYMQTIKDIIQHNMFLLKEVSGPDTLSEFTNNYTFKILFSKKHDNLERTFYNFALITSEKDNQKIVFEPVNTPSIDSTKIWFYGDTITRDDTRVIEERKQKLDKVEHLWQAQVLSDNVIRFIKDIGLYDDFILKSVFGQQSND